MNPRDLKQYSASEEMLKHDLGVGVVTLYQLKNGMSYFVMGEYHNKGALSPTVGARITKDQSIYDVINDSFDRKRLGEMHFENGEIDEEDIFYSVNQKQNFARLTFLQKVQSDLTEDEFVKKYITPMHTESQYQRSVSEFFWKLDEDEAINPNKKDSKFKYPSTEARAQAAKKALENMQLSHFPVSQEITKKLESMQDEKSSWNESSLPLKFYGEKGGRKYSELTGFYLISLTDILKQFKDPKIKSSKYDQDKPTIFIEHEGFPKEEKWKKFFIFEDEIKTIASILSHLTKDNSQSLFKSSSISKQIEDLVSPWTVEKINLDQFKRVNAYQNLAANL